MAEEGFALPCEEGTLLRVRVSPGARGNEVGGAYGRSLRLRVAAPPEGGRANAELERFLAGLLGLPRSGVAVVRGLSGRDKTVLIAGIGPREAERVLLRGNGR